MGYHPYPAYRVHRCFNSVAGPAVTFPWMHYGRTCRVRLVAMHPGPLAPFVGQGTNLCLGPRPATPLAPWRSRRPRSVLAGLGRAVSGCKGICAHGTIWGSCGRIGVAAASIGGPRWGDPDCGNGSPDVRQVDHFDARRAKAGAMIVRHSAIPAIVTSAMVA